MPRLPYPDPDDLSQENRALLDQLAPLNVFRMLAGGGAIFRPFIGLLNAYMNEGALEPELRELIILRVGHLSGSAYELHQHERVSREIGMAEARIRAAGAPLPADLYSEAENAALALVDEVAANVRANEACFNAARAHLSDRQMIELLIVTGIYMMVCRFLESLEIELEEMPVSDSGLDKIRDAAREYRTSGGD